MYIHWRRISRVCLAGLLKLHIMPYKSEAQQRYLESDASPLTEAQKKEWRGATNFDKLPARKSKGSTTRRRHVEIRGNKNQST